MRGAGRRSEYRPAQFCAWRRGAAAWGPFLREKGMMGALQRSLEKAAPMGGRCRFVPRATPPGQTHTDPQPTNNPLCH